jgi:hypothetical protein
LEANGRIARGPDGRGPEVGKEQGRALLIAVDEEYISPLRRACDSEVEGECGLPDAPFNVPDYENHRLSLRSLSHIDLSLYRYRSDIQVKYATVF